MVVSKDNFPISSYFFDGSRLTAGIVSVFSDLAKFPQTPSSVKIEKSEPIYESLKNEPKQKTRNGASHEQI